jgi:hypothetical protein
MKQIYKEQRYMIAWEQNRQSLRNVLDYTRRSNICVTGVLEGEEKEEGDAEKLLDTMDKNIQDLAKDISIELRR